MKILVAIKRVCDPDNANKVGISATTERLISVGLGWQLNPFDEYALEAALRLTEDGRNTKERIGEVVVVTFGPAETEPHLRAALALGAHRALRVEAEDEALDGYLIAKGLATLVAKERPDLVLLGKQTVDGQTNQVGQMLAGMVDWPMATFASAMREEDGTLYVEREVDRGTAAVRLIMPAVVTVDLRITCPTGVRSRYTPAEHRYPDGVRLAALPAVIAAKKKPLGILPLRELVGNAMPQAHYVGYRLPPARIPGRIVDSVAELVELLGTEAKVI